MLLEFVVVGEALIAMVASIGLSSFHFSFLLLDLLLVSPTPMEVSLVLIVEVSMTHITRVLSLGGRSHLQFGY